MEELSFDDVTFAELSTDDDPPSDLDLSSFLSFEEDSFEEESREEESPLPEDPWEEGFLA